MLEFCCFYSDFSAEFFVQPPTAKKRSSAVAEIGRTAHGMGLITVEQR